MGRHVASGVEERGDKQNHCWGRFEIKFLEKRKRSERSSLGRTPVETFWHERRGRMMLKEGGLWKTSPGL